MSDDTAQGMSEERASWHADAPITDEQLESVRRDLDLPLAARGAAFAPFVVRKMLAEINRLNTVLDANRVVRNAAESSSRTYKAVTERLKAERTRLRDENDRLRAQLAEIGETREEYAVRNEGHEAFCATPQGALRIARERTTAKPGAPWHANRRLVGQWREVPDA